MDRWTKNLIWWAVGAIIVVLLAVWLVNTLAPVSAADAVEQRHGIRYYPKSVSAAGYPVGDSGIEEVREVQIRLYELGYDVVVDGIPGPGTDAALRDFQRDRHLAVTGDLDKHTFAALWSRSRAERDGPGSGSGGSGVVDLKCMDCK